MRYLAVGDIHGCYTALTTLAAAVPFTPDDTLITLGDVVDRGPASRAVVDWLIAYGLTSPLVALRGNHEVMMLQAAAKSEFLDFYWTGCGGDTTLASYAQAGRKGRLSDVPALHWEFLKSTRPLYEIDTHFFVHANAYPKCALDAQPESKLFWEFFDEPPPHQSGKIMVCGHTSQRSGRPLNIGHAVCIDTGAYEPHGWLTCLDVQSGRYWQANERGETRGDRLD